MRIPTSVALPFGAFETALRADINKVTNINFMPINRCEGTNESGTLGSIAMT